MGAQSRQQVTGAQFMSRKPAARFGDLAPTPAPVPSAPPAPAPRASEDQPLLPVALPQQRPSRTGKKVIAGHFNPPAAKAFAMLAPEQDKTIQALLAEALNDLFRKNGRHPLF